MSDNLLMPYPTRLASDYSICIVIPALNEGGRLPHLLAELAEIGVHVPAPCVEFLVVDDCSSPDQILLERKGVELAAARLAAAGSPHRIRLLESPRNAGKGSAIRRGWREASAEVAWLGFLDADGAVPASEVWRLIAMLEKDRFDLLAGARICMAGHHIQRSLIRHLQGRAFVSLSERLIPHGFYDPQCGIKLARATFVRPFLDVLREERWLLDLELIALIMRAGGRCIEEPIDWSDAGDSKVVPILDPFRMAIGLFQLRRRLARLPEKVFRRVEC